MGKLITREEMSVSPKWYMADAYYSSEGNGRYIYNIYTDIAIGGRCAINHSSLECSNNAITRNIRRWIEREIPDTVIVTNIDNSYNVYWGDDPNDWEKTYKVKNDFMVFHFEDESSAVLFKLAFSNLVVPVTANHPTADVNQKRITVGKDGYEGHR